MLLVYFESLLVGKIREVLCILHVGIVCSVNCMANMILL